MFPTSNYYNRPGFSDKFFTIYYNFVESPYTWCYNGICSIRAIARCLEYVEPRIRRDPSKPVDDGTDRSEPIDGIQAPPRSYTVRGCVWLRRTSGIPDERGDKRKKDTRSHTCDVDDTLCVVAVLLRTSGKKEWKQKKKKTKNRPWMLWYSREHGP